MTREQIIVNVFSFLGFKVTEDGVMTTTTKFAGFFAKQLVREGKLIKTDSHTYIILKH